MVFFLVFIYEKECKMEKSIYGKRRQLREPLVIFMNYFLCLVRNPTCEPMLETKRAFGHLHELFMFGQEPHLWAHAGDQESLWSSTWIIYVWSGTTPVSPCWRPSSRPPTRRSCPPQPRRQRHSWRLWAW